MSNDIDDVIKRATAQGWRHTRTNAGHHQFFAPNKHNIVTTGGTPSDHRAWDNFMADMKRAGYVNGATTSLSDALAQARAGDAGDADAPVRAPNGGAKLSASQLIVDVLSRHPEGMQVADLTAVVRSARPELSEKITTTSLSQMRLRGTVVNPHRGFWQLTRDAKPREAPAAPAAESTAVAAASVDLSVAGIDTGDEAIDRDLRTIDDALAALAALEDVVRRNRAVLQQFAKLKQMLGVVGK
jgi:hypothetical protein